jgi:hypothetical protein
MGATPGVIAGTVHDARGIPIADARVYFIEGPEPLPEIAALTDAKGTFSLTAPQEGRYTVQGRADGFAPKSVAVEVSAGKTVTIDIKLK